MGRGRKIAKRFKNIDGPPPEGKKRFSQILDAIGADERRERVSVSDLMRAMDARAVAALILFFSLPNAVPTPPGTSAILGMPLLYLCYQMMLAKLPWLPALIADRSMTRDDFRALVGENAKRLVETGENTRLVSIGVEFLDNTNSKAFERIAARTATSGFRERRPRIGNRRRIVRVVPANDVVNERRVKNRARHGPDLVEGRCERDCAVPADPSVGRLHADGSSQRSRLAD